MHGQSRIEFIFGVVIFAVIIIYIVNQINTVFSKMINDYGTDTLKAEAVNVIKILVENESGIITNQPYNFSKQKVYNLNQSCDNLNVFNLGNYRLKIYNSTNLLLFCGTDTLRPPKVFVIKYVSVENDYGNITLEMW